MPKKLDLYLPVTLLQQYRAIQLEQPKIWAAIFHRINHVIIFLPGGQHKEYTIDEYINGFVEIPVQDLPFDDALLEPVQMPVDAGTQLKMEKELDRNLMVKQEGTAGTDGG